LGFLKDAINNWAENLAEDEIAAVLPLNLHTASIQSSVCGEKFDDETPKLEE